MSIVTRFAPSPTGFLHIGGARTALFNWLHARHHGGQFLLRVEDTDRERSTPEATRAILDGLEWLGLPWDGEVVYQSSRARRHAEVAHQLVAAGQAYRCYCTPGELAAMRKRAEQEKRPDRYDGRWRDRDPSDAPAGVPPVIRLRVPKPGSTSVNDSVQGSVSVANDEIDDFVLLRADGSPTYMLSVVVDDHDMGITDVIRGDDHFTNTFRQCQIHDLLGWTRPRFAHVPLIHGPDGKKLSKRHGALGVETYRDAGYLPDALRNVLLRLGWSHGDDEILSTEDAIRWFDIADVGKSAARFDRERLDHVNGHYIRTADAETLARETARRLKARNMALDNDATRKILAGMPSLQNRARTLEDLATMAVFLVQPVAPDEESARLLTDDARPVLGRLIEELREVSSWQDNDIEASLRQFAAREKRKLGAIAQPLRVALTGRKASPGIFEVMRILGRDETLQRIREVAPE